MTKIQTKINVAKNPAPNFAKRKQMEQAEDSSPNPPFPFATSEFKKE
jgi:hypothetical protein